MIRMKQRSAKPIRKLRIGTLAGAIVSVLLWALEDFWSIRMSASTAAALATIVYAAIAYFVAPAPEDFIERDEPE